jgi:hypothetical protein
VRLYFLDAEYGFAKATHTVVSLYSFVQYYAAQKTIQYTHNALDKICSCDLSY